MTMSFMDLPASPMACKDFNFRHPALNSRDDEDHHRQRGNRKSSLNAAPEPLL
ncbi:hypothetical protein [Sphingobium chlorophenolicum]|uniref:hypothetical protein n=1 Tax=Sphingobium chlorophenolicum TaxID=46429 RepID=UPI00138DFDF9|nr:hypothetical protein [Sphingobium chlorophenolicum]